MGEAFINMPETKFRNSQGQLWTERLIWEVANTTKINVLYTLGREDRTEGEKVIRSLYRLYMEIADPTEYTFAVTCFEGWDHWLQITETYWMKPLLVSWRRELEVKLRSAALNRIITAASGTGKEAAALNRFIVERGYDTPRSTKGRPSKSDIAQAAHDQAQASMSTTEEAKRVGLN